MSATSSPSDTSRLSRATTSGGEWPVPVYVLHGGQLHVPPVVARGPAPVRLAPAVQGREKELGAVRVRVARRERHRPDLPRPVAVPPPDAERDVLDAERRLPQAGRELLRDGVGDAGPDPF